MQLQLFPGDTFRVLMREGATETHAGVFVVADAPGRPPCWRVRRGGDTSLTADERSALGDAAVRYLADVDELLCMTAATATAMVERARGGGSTEDDAP